MTSITPNSNRSGMPACKSKNKSVVVPGTRMFENPEAVLEQFDKEIEIVKAKLKEVRRQKKELKQLKQKNRKRR